MIRVFSCLPSMPFGPPQSSLTLLAVPRVRIYCGIPGPGKAGGYFGSQAWLTSPNKAKLRVQTISHDSTGCAGPKPSLGCCSWPSESFMEKKNKI